jgi:LacI family transcriptional regulator
MNASPDRKPTIKQVAEYAGVSIKTVSRVINNERYVTQGARERVAEAMRQLAFQPNQAARALAGKKSHQIALICDNPSPYYVYEVQAGVRARCVEQNVRMIAQPYSISSKNLIEEIDSLIVQTNPDGLILTPPITDYLPVIEMLQRRQIKFVCMSPDVLSSQFAAAFIDNEGAAASIVSHLITLGHQRIGLIAGHPDYATSRQRMAGYRRALDEANLRFDPSLVAVGRYDFRSGATATADLLKLSDPPTAIFASSDDMAAGALATAHHLGIHVPDQLSIAGFDDTALAEIVWPPLTTIRQPTREIAYAAADLLFRDDNEIEHRRVDYALVIRGSTAPLNPTRSAR